ncbi:uncharacterized protein LOC116851948 [Odontomachus brunneus]|uniref:uncharacterized protein LOC116851948 n=1 Tax=Odontomachus brunneus TaxID=486640 RepID=UPI0013F1B3D9|nr:uncharacterized protein LOC116851948 [Odontomachus brunneus]
MRCTGIKNILVVTMGKSSVKLFFNIVLIFTVASADSNLNNSINCSLISEPTSIIEIVPIRYNVKLTINPEMRTIITIADIMIHVKLPLRNIKLHGREIKANILASKIMTINSLSNCNYGYAHNKLKNFDYCEENDILILTFEKRILTGYYCIHLELESSLFYNEVIFPYFLNEDHNNNRWLITNLYKSNAIRRLFPCWDVPQIKASFNISIRHPINYTVLSSAPIRYKSIEKGGTELTSFRESSSMPTYQLAIAMVNKMKMHNDYKNIYFFWHQSNRTRRFKYAQDITHLIIFYLVEYTNMDVLNVTEKIDHIIVPNGPIKSAGGRQLIIYREKDVFYDSTSETFGQNIEVVKLIAYEIARQWFIGYASPYLKNDIGINEILASFYSYHITAELLTTNLATDKLMQLFVVQNLQTALDSNYSLELESIILKAKGDDGIHGLLYSLLYHKKAFVLIRMLSCLVTPKVFQQVIEKYIHTRTENLWILLEEHYLQKDNRRYTIREIIYSWIKTVHHPTLRIIKQDHRLTVQYTSEMTKGQNNWPTIPINYVTRSNLTSYNITNFIWLESNQVEVIADIDPTDFYILNMGLTGFYRINYDLKNWLTISSYLQFDNYSNIPAINRAQLINDAYYYTKKGELNLFIFIEIIQYLRYETDYIPWYPMFNIMVDMSAYLQHPRGLATKQQFIYPLHELLQNVGYEERPGDNEMTKSLRLLTVTWACKLGHDSCREAATDRLITYIYNQTKTIPLLWKDWVLCAGMMQLTSTNWNNILEDSIEHKKLGFLDYLTCSEDAKIITNYLSLMLRANLGEHIGFPMGKIYLTIVKKHLRKPIVLKYVLENYYETLNRFHTDFEKSTLLTYIFMNVDTMEALEQIHTYARHNFPVDDRRLWNTFYDLKALRSRQIIKELNKFEMSIQVLVSKMETTSLKLLFIITMMFPAANHATWEDFMKHLHTCGQTSADQVAPISHDVTLKIKPERNILSGKTDITIQVKLLTTNISLHAHNLEIDMACTMIMKPGTEPECREENAASKLLRITYCSENGITTLIFTDYILPGRYILHIEHFFLMDNNENKIIYPYTWNNESRWIVTNLYSSNAVRRLFPSWETTTKQSFHMKMNYDKSYIAYLNIHNTPTEHSYNKGNTQTTLFSNVYQTSINSLSFMFIDKRDLMINTNYDMNLLQQESNVTATLKYMQIFTLQTILHFKRVIKITLSEVINEINYVVLPICPMKSAGRFGLIAYREKDVTYKKGVDFPGKMIDIAKLVSYEMSRQLFISVMNSHLNIEDKWFDEILASFYSFYIVEKIWLTEQMMELFVVQNLQTALDSDIYLELKPIIHKSKSDYGIDGLLYPLLYHKKAFALIRMLVYLFTPQEFDEIIKRYVQSRNVNFWTIVEEVYPEIYSKRLRAIKEIMNSCLTEAHHPEMHIIRNYSDETATLQCNTATFSKNISNFKIPFTYLSFTFTPDMQLHDAVFWCEGNETKSISFLDSNNFLLFNKEQFGYYRVNYDSRNWLLLATHLQSAAFTSIPVLNRAQIVNDAFYFTTVGKMDSRIFFKLIKFLNNEISYIVWYPMFNIFSYISAFLKLPIGDSTKTNFQIILNSVLRKVGYEERETDNTMTMPLRLLAIKWACEFGNKECRNAVAEKLIANIYNSEQNIFAQWTYRICCTGNLNMTVSELIWQQGIREENIKILEHLMCIENENILIYYLELITNITYENNISKLPMGRLYRSVIKKHIEKQKVLNFFLDNYFQIIDRFPNEFGTHDNLTLIGDIVMNSHSDIVFGKINMRITKEFFGDKLRSSIEKLIGIRRSQISSQRRKFKMFYD